MDADDLGLPSYGRRRVPGLRREELAELLAPEEVDALLERIESLLEAGTFPPPRGGFPLPWPLF